MKKYSSLLSFYALGVIEHGMTNAHSDIRITWPLYLLYLPGMYSHEIEEPHYQIKGVRVHFNTSGTIGERMKA